MRAGHAGFDTTPLFEADALLEDVPVGLVHLGSVEVAWKVHRAVALQQLKLALFSHKIHVGRGILYAESPLGVGFAFDAEVGASALHPARVHLEVVAREFSQIEGRRALEAQAVGLVGQTAAGRSGSIGVGGKGGAA